MSPEQARGDATDKKADVWAFGCVLFEMLTGRVTFSGKTVSDVLAEVLRIDPEWKSLPPNLHPQIRLLLERSLEKESKDRYHDIADARLDIQKALADSGEVLVQPMTEVVQTAPPSKLPWVAAIVLGIIVAGVAGWSLRPSEPGSVGRFYHVLPEGHAFSSVNRMIVAVSPDGSRMVYVANGQLYVRSMDALGAIPIPGTDENPSNPFFSPDGQWIGYFSRSALQLKKIAVSGGAPVTLSDAENPYGAPFWGTDDTIVWGQSQGIMRVSANGGTPEVLLSDPDAWSPQMLPGGSSVLFGHIVYTLDDVLFAVPFDLDTLEVVGGPVAMVEGVRAPPPQFAVSASGLLAFVPGNVEGGERRLVWVDRQGTVEPIPAPPRRYDDPRISQDGQRIVVQTEGPDSDVWIYDIARDTLRRVTFEGNGDTPLWTPDGKRVTFAKRGGGRTSLSWKASDGSGAEELLRESEYVEYPLSWSPDGRFLAFHSEQPTTGFDIWILPMEEEREAQPFLQTRFQERHAVFSPDGDWLAYVSDESGQDEVYVQPFPGPGEKWLISNEGGTEPVWSASGELFFRSVNKIMAVEITTQPSFSPGKPTLLFESRFLSPGVSRSDYDVTPDGQRFLMMENEETGSKINIVLTWFQELKEKVPVP
jgi:serine/threonine-protein kinase